jgi:hypothetical protein
MYIQNSYSINNNSIEKEVNNGKFRSFENGAC